jgi:hypothetical protein
MVLSNGEALLSQDYPPAYFSALFIAAADRVMAAARGR